MTRQHLDDRPFALPEISIRQLEYLVATADASTWANAADAVGVSPPALSQGIAELERRLGVELFEQQGRRRVLRHDADAVVEHARRMLALAGDLARWADEYRHASRGRVRLGMIDIAAVSYYPELVRRYRNDHAEVDFRLTVGPSAQLLQKLSDGVLDVVVCVQPSTHPFGTIVEPLRDDPMFIIAPPGVEVGAATEWGPWVMFPDGSHTRGRVTDQLIAAGARTDVVAESHQPEVLAEMVQMGIGWAVLPVPDDARFGDAVIGPELFQRRLVLVTRDDSIPSPAGTSLIEAFRSESDLSQLAQSSPARVPSV